MRRQLREKANEVFSHVVEYGHTQDHGKESVCIVARIQSVRGFLHLARSMRLIKPVNVTVLEREYESLEDFFAREMDFSQDEASVSDRKEYAKESKKKYGKTQIISKPIKAKISQKKVLPEKDKSRIVFKRRTKELKDSKGHSIVSDMKNNEEQIPSAAAEEENSSGNIGGINERQKAIIGRLKETNSAKVSDFYSFFSEISSKTIQRDLQDLVQKNILKKEGDKRWTLYTLINSV